jgi:hypothetical protein
MSTRAYLISLSGQGDVHTILIDEAAWDYLCNAGDGRAIPEELIQDFVAHQREQGDRTNSDSNLETLARRALAWNARSGSTDNDIAMSMGGTVFNGQRWNRYGSRDTKELMQFVRMNNLVIEDEFEGGIY